MATLQELRRKNEKLRNRLKAKRELLDIGEARNRLLKENKALLLEAKYGKQMRFAKSVGRKTSKVGSKLGRGIGRGLWTMAKRIDEAGRKEEMARRKVMRKPKRKVRKKRTKKRKR